MPPWKMRTSPIPRIECSSRLPTSINVGMHLYIITNLVVRADANVAVAANEIARTGATEKEKDAKDFGGKGEEVGRIKGGRQLHQIQPLVHARRPNRVVA